jgi:hypothetical protein
MPVVQDAALFADRAASARPAESPRYLRGRPHPANYEPAARANASRPLSRLIYCA